MNTMNPFENIIFALLTTAAVEAPVFVHSQHGVLLLNAGENLVANLLAAFQKPAAPIAPAATK